MKTNEELNKIMKNELFEEIREGMRALGWLNSANEALLTDEDIIRISLESFLCKIEDWIKDYIDDLKFNKGAK